MGETLSVQFVQPSVELYGADRMALTSAVAMRDSRVEVVVDVPSQGRLADLLRDAGLSVRIRPFPVARKSLLSAHRIVPFLFSVARGLASNVLLLRKEKPRVTYVNTLTAPTWVLASWLTRIPVIIHVREAETAGGLAWKVLTQQCRLASRVICNSASTHAALESEGVLRKGRGVVLYNGRLKRRSVLSNSKRVPERVCLVGRLAPRKGQDVAIQAMSEVVQHHPRAHLLIAGDVFPGYEWYRDKLKLQIETLNLTKNVTLLGFSEETRSIYESSSICVVPSLIEPFGNVAVEAMDAGAVVVASDVQGLAEIVTHASTGLLVPSAAPGRLAMAIVELLDAPELAERYRRAAHADVNERFSVDAYAISLLSHLREVSGT